MSRTSSRDLFEENVARPSPHVKGHNQHGETTNSHHRTGQECYRNKRDRPAMTPHGRATGGRLQLREQQCRTRTVLKSRRSPKDRVRI